MPALQLHQVLTDPESGEEEHTLRLQSPAHKGVLSRGEVL